MSEDPRVFVLCANPRTGTSLMCEILSRLGVEIRSTTDTPESIASRTKRMARRYAGTDYEMNEKFHEIGDHLWYHLHHIYHQPFSGCKIVGVPSAVQWDLIFSVPSKVILMCRDPESIRQSQEGAKISPAPVGCNTDRHTMLYELGLEIIGDGDAPGLITDKVSVEKLKSLFNEKLNELPRPDVQPWERRNAMIARRQALVESKLIDRKEKVLASTFDHQLPAFDYKAVWYEDLIEDRERITSEVATWIGADPARYEYAWLAVNKEKNRFAIDGLEKGL